MYVHVEAPDEASHEGSLPGEIKAIERIDAEVVGPILDRIGEDVRLMVVTDHDDAPFYENALRLPCPIRHFPERAHRAGRDLR